MPCLPDGSGSRPSVKPPDELAANCFASAGLSKGERPTSKHRASRRAPVEHPAWPGAPDVMYTTLNGFHPSDSFEFSANPRQQVLRIAQFHPPSVAACFVLSSWVRSSSARIQDDGNGATRNSTHSPTAVERSMQATPTEPCGAHPSDSFEFVDAATK